MHTYELNGDLCYDPMVEFLVNSSDKTLTASMFQQSIPPLYQYIDDDGIGQSIDGNGNERTVKNLRPQINEFSKQWFQNISEQGFMPVKANLVMGVDDEVRVTFDKDGNMIMPEPEEPEKEYDLGFGYLGNGITVWNRAEEVNRDYRTVAHIATDRTITFYDQDMPHEVREQIDAVAKSPDTRAFGLSPSPENVPPHIDGAPAPASVYEAVKRTMPEPVKAPTLDMSLPDPTISASEMNQYGYSYDDMLPLTQGKAVELFDADHTIYLLYPDNTEGAAFDRDEIRNFDGLFGIERADWERSPIFAAQMAVAANAAGKREAELLHGNGNRFGIDRKSVV
jgi:hypothetical protein